MPPTLLSPRQLAAKLDVSYDDVLAWTRDDLIPHICVSGRYYYHLSRVVRALHKNGAARPEGSVPA